MRKPAKSAGSGSAGESQNTSEQSATDAVELLKADHRQVEQLFEQCKSAGDDHRQKKNLVQQIATELMIHTIIEEEIFYPACRDKADEEDALDEAQVEHDSVKLFVEELLACSPDDEFYDAKIEVLSEYVKHHVGEEEKTGDGIFAKAKKAGVDLSALGARLQARKSELMANEENVRANPPQIRSLYLLQHNQEHRAMPRYSNDRDRDEQGRFMSDDDRDYNRGRGGYRRSSNRDDDYEDRFGGHGERYGRERDENGRFMSEDDREYRGRGGSRDYDEDYNERGSSRGRGWYGDSEGHSRAAQQRGYGSRSRYEEDDDYGRGRSHHEHGGWYGDERGHSEASHRGWEGRSDYRSRGRGEEDDEYRSHRGGQGGGHRGWSGDPEGHAEASRRGWRNR